MITASIVVHESPKEQLDKVLECLQRSAVDRIWIIDNSPTDKLQEILENSPRVEYLYVANNGFGAGHNIAMKMAIETGSDFHLVLNADVWWEGDVIKKLTEYIEKNKDVGLVAPKIFYPDGILQYTCRMLPTPYDLFLKRFIPKRLARKRMKRYLLANHDHDFKLNCPYLLGSFLLFRVETLKEVGLFDERFFMYPEDIDITRRIHKKNKTIYYPECSIVHEHQAASRKNIRMLFIHISNMVKYFNKWGWWRDNERKIYNKTLQSAIHPLEDSKDQKGRG